MSEKNIFLKKNYDDNGLQKHTNICNICKVFES
jgi:hypothetical protein